MPERRRGDEYRQRTARLAAGHQATEDDPVEEWARRAERVPAILHERCVKKAAKQYAGRAGLLVYLNINDYGIRQREIETCFQNATAPAKASFASVWVLWKVQAYHSWEQGEPVRQVK